MEGAVFVIGAVLVVFAVLAGFSITPALAHVTVYFSPDPSTISLEPGETMMIQVMADVDANETDGFCCFQVGVTFAADEYFNPTVINITKAENPCRVYIPGYGCIDTYWNDTFTAVAQKPTCECAPPYPGRFRWMTGCNKVGFDGPITVPIANVTIKAIGPGTSPLNFTHCICYEPTVGSSRLFDKHADRIPPENITWINSSITVTAPQETYSKELVEGWNLISLPLTADNMTVANIIDKSLSGKYDALYRYDAVNKSWVAMDSSDVMENGVGYFIHMTEDGTWTYNGSAYTDMDISLQQGLNMIGWLNCSKPIDDALSSIEGDYWYVARWNATAQKFEVYNPVAPPQFNDFTTMGRGEGYFISMKGAETLTESC